MRRIALFFALLYSVSAAEPIYLALLAGPGDLVYLSPAGKVLSSVPVGQLPREMAFSPDLRYLYVTAGGNTVSIVDVSARRRIGDIPLGDFHRPHGIAVHPKTGQIAVVTEAPARLLLVDATRRSLIKNFDTKGGSPTMVAFGPGGTWAYVSNSQSGTVAAINVESGETKVIRTGEHPAESVLSANGKELYVLNRDGNNVAVIDTDKQQVIANIIAGKGPTRGAVAGNGKLVYALRNERRVAIADTRQRRQTDYVLVPGEPISCSVSNDGKFALVSTATSGTIYIISLASSKISGEIKTVEGSAPGPVLEMPDPLK